MEAQKFLDFCEARQSSLFKDDLKMRSKWYSSAAVSSSKTSNVTLWGRMTRQEAPVSPTHARHEQKCGRSADGWKVAADFTAANPASLFHVLSPLLPPPLLHVLLNPSTWLVLFKARTRHKWRTGDFPWSQRDWSGAPEEEGLRGLNGSVGAGLCGEWIRQVPAAERRPADGRVLPGIMLPSSN